MLRLFCHFAWLVTGWLKFPWSVYPTSVYMYLYIYILYYIYIYLHMFVLHMANLMITPRFQGQKKYVGPAVPWCQKRTCKTLTPIIRWLIVVNSNNKTRISVYLDLICWLIPTCFRFLGKKNMEIASEFLICQLWMNPRVFTCAGTIYYCSQLPSGKQT